MVARLANTHGDRRPFLKWAGNKYRVLPHIRLRLPPGKRLVEPFAGSGAVFLNTDYDHRQSRRKAALFVYLNRHGYNGLCRYNRRGGFNVPFGRYVRPHFPEAEMLAFHAHAQRADFRVQSFEANFTSYSRDGFDLEQQRHLAELAAETAARGIPVLISNHDTPFTREAYANAAELDSFPVHRSISCNGARREAARELLALFV